MSARSLLLSCAALAACGKSGAKLDGDPAAVTKLAAAMTQQVPAPLSLRDCEPADLAGAPTLTFRSLLALGKQPIPTTPDQSEWINPNALDAPAVRTLIDAAGDADARREAAGELLRAPAWVVYRVDLVDAPIALGVKELKIGTVAARVIRYDHTGRPTCAKVFYAQNDKAKSDWAIAKSDRPAIDPAIRDAMRADLGEQLVKKVPR